MARRRSASAADASSTAWPTWTCTKLAPICERIVIASVTSTSESTFEADRREPKRRIAAGPIELDANQAIAGRNGKRPQVQRVDDAEHGCRGADAEADGRDSSTRRDRVRFPAA